jgi:Iap family predicted aminopeptidase
MTIKDLKEAHIQREKAKAMEDPNLHQTIKDMIVTTVERNCKWDTHQHYREILDDIISDLQQYAETLPTADQLMFANKL